jgi:adenylate cyclase
VLPPAELCSLLNRSFEAIAAALIAEEGLLDKFIGDSLASVILASRLERLTRQFPDTPILISRALLELRPNRLEVVPLGFHQLTGLPDPVDVYGLLGLR